MGVKTCFRNNCENIMCARYSDTHGYICDECFTELLHSSSISIKIFMRSEKDEDMPIEDKRAYLEKVFSNG